MIEPFGTAAAPRGDDASDAAAKWLVGGRLACVLHLGDGALAYRLAAQGHEVVVAGDDVRSARHPDVLYVRTSGDRLPFAAASFDAVVAPHLQESPLALSEYSRVMRPGGWLSSVSQDHDEDLPWVRRLREVVGSRPSPGPERSDLLAASGLFEEAETTRFASWTQLDLAGVLAFARETGRGGLDDTAAARVREIVAHTAPPSGQLRLRRVTRCVRARTRPDSRPADQPPAETLLFDLN